MLREVTKMQGIRIEALKREVRKKNWRRKIRNKVRENYKRYNASKFGCR